VFTARYGLSLYTIQFSVSLSVQLYPFTSIFRAVHAKCQLLCAVEVTRYIVGEQRDLQLHRIKLLTSPLDRTECTHRKQDSTNHRPDDVAQTIEHFQRRL